MKIGDIVSLRSGGPDMVISYIEPHYGRANCSWVHDGQYHSAVIPLSALRADSEPKHGETSLIVSYISPYLRERAVVTVRGCMTLKEFKDAMKDMVSTGGSFRFDGEE